MDRDYLRKEVSKAKPQRILEIGTCQGDGGVAMIREAQKHNENIEYWGFDLFEDVTAEDRQNEDRDSEYFMEPASIEAAEMKLEATGAKVHLIKGNTRETLPEADLPKMDFIYIDGGHSIETIKSDWENAKKLMHEDTVVIFDDYWNRDDCGAKPVVDEIKEYNVEVSDVEESIEENWGQLEIRRAKVWS